MKKTYMKNVKQRTFRKNRPNKMSIEKFLFLQIIILSAFCFLKPDICTSLPGKSIVESTDIFINILAYGIAISTVFTLLTGKCSYTSIYCDLVIPIGLYITLANLATRKKFMLIMFIFSAALSITYIVHMIIARKRIGIRFTWNYHFKIARGVQILLAACFSVIIAAVTAESMLGNSTYKPDNIKAMKDNENEVSIKNNSEILQLLREDQWNNLDYRERLNVLQTVADIEQSYLGLSEEYIINIGSADLYRDYTGLQAYWNDSTREIILDINLLMNETSDKALEAVLHESYHSFQHQLVRVYESLDESTKKLYCFRKAETYEQEENNYISGMDDYDKYYNQEIEVDARAYARERAEAYYIE